MNEVLLVYVTCPDRALARMIGLSVVKERLAACANLLGEIEAIYHWEGKLEEGRECALLLKTTRARLKALTARVLELHLYTTPALVALPITGGSAAFLSWVQTETALTEQCEG